MGKLMVGVARFLPLCTLLLSLIIGITACGGGGSGDESSLEQITKKVGLQFLSIVADKPDQGWTSYKVAFAVVNQNASWIRFNPILNPNYTPVSGALVLRAHDSSVETREKQRYPAKPSFGTWNRDANAPILIVLPTGIPITARNDSAFTVTFKVPELLHPHRIVIGSMSFEINTANKQPTRAKLPAQKLPATLRVGEIELSIGPTVSERVEAGYWLPKGDKRVPGNIFQSIDGAPPSYVNIEFNAKNTDITADRSLKALVMVMDEAGGIYEPRPILSVECPSLEEKVGPGQTYHGRFCFMLPASHAIKPAPLILAINGGGMIDGRWIRTDKLLTFDSTQVANCVENPKLPELAGNPNTYTYPVVSDKTFSIPGEESGTIEGQTAHRLRFRGQKGKTIIISISPRPKPNTWWGIQLFDPSAIPILQTGISESDSEGIPLLCDGTYSLHILPSSAGPNYTLSVRVQ